MDQSTQPEVQNDNPWKHFAELPKPTKMPLAVAIGLYALASFAIPLSFYYKWLPWFFGAFLLVGSAFLVRRMKSGIWMTLVAGVAAALVSGIFISRANAPLAIGVLTISLCTGVMSGCFFATSTRCWWGAAVISVLVSGATFALTRDWFPAVTAFSLFPATLFLGVATNMGQKRTMAICYTVGGFLAVSITLFLLWFWKTNGTVNFNAILNLWNHAREQMIAEQISMRDSYLEYFRNMLSEGTWSAAQIQYVEQSLDRIMQTMSDENLANSVNKLFNLFPALVFVVCAIPAFLAQKMLNAAYFSNGMQKAVTPESEFFTMSVPAAALFIPVTFITLMFSGSLSIPVMVSSNLCVMLLPGFLVIGVHAYRTRLISLKGGARGMFLAISLFLVCCSSIGVFLLLGLYGAYERIHKAFMRKMAEKMKDSNDRDLD